MEALEYIKSKHNGEIPYKYGANECAKLMEAYALAQNKELREVLKKMTDAFNVIPDSREEEEQDEAIDLAYKLLNN